MLQTMRGLLALGCVISICGATPYSLGPDADIDITLTPSDNGLRFVAKRNDDTILVGTLNSGKDMSSVNCQIDQPKCEVDGGTLSIERIEAGFQVVWETLDKSTVFQDCFDLPDGTNWYGGPERRLQAWPLEKMTIDGNNPYVLGRWDNFAVAERYWLNSKGVFIYLKEHVPLFVDQNIANEKKVCFVAKLANPYINRTRNILDYRIVFQSDAKAAHLFAVRNYLGKPEGHPNPKMVSEPIWTTWANFKSEITQDMVLGFAQSISDHGYKGQFEIDEKWESCYGSQEFAVERFPDISSAVNKIKEMNFRVTLWIHPFVNNDCQTNSEEGIAKGYFVANTENSTKASWWAADDSHQIDFTNPEAVKWWSDRLEKLLKHPNVDSFKFDAGETDYAPQPAVYRNVDPETVPNILSSSYIRACAKFGDLIEVRSAWRTQDLPIFVRMVEKDSHWGENNGLPSLITTLLQMNMNGYSMVLPDVIGGNGHNVAPTAQLLVRWTQANTFMPAMQFSYLPWEITSPNYDVPGIVQKSINLHQQYSEVILRAMKKTVEDGTPVNPPIWWLDPNDPVALACNDEFLLGEEILVAPVIVEGATSRKVYLPRATWRDGNNNTIYQGPITLDYPADITTLPYFIREST